MEETYLQFSKYFTPRMVLRTVWFTLLISYLHRVVLRPFDLYIPLDLYTSLYIPPGPSNLANIMLLLPQRNSATSLHEAYNSLPVYKNMINKDRSKILSILLFFPLVVTSVNFIWNHFTPRTECNVVFIRWVRIDKILPWRIRWSPTLSTNFRKRVRLPHTDYFSEYQWVDKGGEEGDEEGWRIRG